MFNIQETKEIQIHKKLLFIDELSSSALSNFKSLTNKAYEEFWFGAIPPNELVQAMGSTALDMFTKSAQAQQFIHTIDHTYEPLPIPNGYEIIWKEDGSAEITGEYIETLEE